MAKKKEKPPPDAIIESHTVLTCPNCDGEMREVEGFLEIVRFPFKRPIITETYRCVNGDCSYTEKVSR